MLNCSIWCPLTALIIEIHVRALLVFLRGDLRLLMPLEPSHVLLVEAPTVLLELLGSEELLVGALLEVEHEEQRIHGQALEQVGQLCLCSELRCCGERGMGVRVEVPRRVIQQAKCNTNRLFTNIQLLLAAMF